VSFWRDSEHSGTTTAVALTAMAVWFAVTVIVSPLDPGPDWFDTSDFPHVDAALIGGAAALVAAGTVAAFARWLRHRSGR